MKSQNNGFSFIELLVTITLVSIMMVIAVTYDNNYKLSQYNVRRIDDVTTLNNSMKSFIMRNHTMPDPTGNIQFYDDKGGYLHDGTGSFGESAFVTPETFPKDTVNYLPMDPQTSHYYAYGRRNDGILNYEFATIINDGGEYSTYLRGSYRGEGPLSLIKEYNGPNFVDNGSSDYLPYDPTEMKLTGRIYYWSGTVQYSTDNGDTWKNFTDLKQPFGEGDTLKVFSGGMTKIYLSDGAELQLGSATSDSILKFDTLKYDEDNNITSKVEALLTMGEVWVRAPKYYHKSSFSIETDGQAATVRGTVFGIKKDTVANTKTYILAEGKIEVGPTDPTDNASHIQILDRGDISGIVNNTESGSVTLEVSAGSDPLSLTESGCTPRTTDNLGNKLNSCNLKTGARATGADLDRANELLHGTDYFNGSYLPELLEASKNNSSRTFRLRNIGANTIEISTKTGAADPGFRWDDGKMYTGAIDAGSKMITYTGADTDFIDSTMFFIRLCDDPARDKPAHTGSRVCTGILPANYFGKSDFSFSGATLQNSRFLYDDVQCATGYESWIRGLCIADTTTFYEDFSQIDEKWLAQRFDDSYLDSLIRGFGLPYANFVRLFSPQYTKGDSGIVAEIGSAVGSAVGSGVVYTKGSGISLVSGSGNYLSYPARGVIDGSGGTIEIVVDADELKKAGYSYLFDMQKDDDPNITTNRVRMYKNTSYLEFRFSDSDAFKVGYARIDNSDLMKLPSGDVTITAKYGSGVASISVGSIVNKKNSTYLKIPASLNISASDSFYIGSQVRGALSISSPYPPLQYPGLIKSVRIYNTTATN